MGLRGFLFFCTGLSLVVASGRYSSLQSVGFSCCWTQALGARASVVSVLGLSCSTARGILPDQGSSTSPLHCLGDSSPLCHQESLGLLILMSFSGPLNLASDGFLAAPPLISSCWNMPFGTKGRSQRWEYCLQDTEDKRKRPPCLGVLIAKFRLK